MTTKKNSLGSQKQDGFALLMIVAVIVVIVAVGAAGFFVYKKRSTSSSSSVDTSNPSQFVTASFVDLSKIFSISKFRSLQGHDFSKGGETCRSMKHYFTPQRTQKGMELVGKNNGIPPKPDGTNDIDIFSPFDGKITRIEAEHFPVGEQIYLVPDAASNYTVRIFHVFKSDGIKVGSKLSAGQKIGVISSYSDTDISVENKDKYLSVFEVMTDSVFAEYQARDAKTRDDFIISREHRDAHPVACNQEKNSDQKFYLPDNYDQTGDEVHLSGYKNPIDPNAPKMNEWHGTNGTSGEGQNSTSN